MLNDLEKIQDKIRKLLALSNNPEEHEAKAALLKAQELMAKYKLSMEDDAGHTENAVKHIKTDIAYSKQKNIWIGTLAMVISSNYCCKTYNTHLRKARTYHVCICGLEDDADVCLEVFRYAVGFVTTEIKRRTRNALTAEERRLISDSYGIGFCDGLRGEYERQRGEHQEYGLVLLTPKEVQEELDSMNLEKHKPRRYRINREHYNSGYADGARFSSKGARSCLMPES